MNIKGRGVQFNPDNKFLNTKYAAGDAEGFGVYDIPDDDSVPLRTEFFAEKAKSIISSNDSPDIPQSLSVNPYVGCEHGCTYCYARNAHEYHGFSAGLDFETKIMVKFNAPQLLEQAFNKPSHRPVPIMLSGNTDCYQPAEKDYRLTRSLLGIMLRYRHPVSIITKNTLVLRDIDIIQQLAELNLVHVFFSINSLNEELRRKMEPRTATAESKLKVMQKFSEAGVPTGIMTAPVIPGLNDHEIPELIKRASEAGALAAGYTLVRLNGAISHLFDDWIRTVFPDKAGKVLSQIEACHRGQLNDSNWGKRMTGEGPVAEAIAKLHRISRKKFLADRKLPDYDLSLFKPGRQLTLF